ncbi:MAG: hypothetical protein ACP5IL_09275 [Syntrophobacteraceae bacterium]
MEKERAEEILGCCACEDDISETFPGLSCADKKRLFTTRELDVLARIRESSLRAGALKRQINHPDGQLRQAAQIELDSLRLARAQLENERLAARDERMRLLGHL